MRKNMITPVFTVSITSSPRATIAHLRVNKCTKFHRKIFNGFQVIERTRFVTDRRTDRRTGKDNMSPDPEEGRHKYQ